MTTTIQGKHLGDPLPTLQRQGAGQGLAGIVEEEAWGLIGGEDQLRSGSWGVSCSLMDPGWRQLLNILRPERVPEGPGEGPGHPAGAGGGAPAWRSWE